MVKEPHCRGFEEDKSWKLDDWINHEGIKYDTLNDKWFEIITSRESLSKRTSHKETPDVFHGFL